MGWEAATSAERGGESGETGWREKRTPFGPRKNPRVEWIDFGPSPRAGRRRRRRRRRATRATRRGREERAHVVDDGGDRTHRDRGPRGRELRLPRARAHRAGGSGALRDTAVLRLGTRDASNRARARVPRAVAPPPDARRSRGRLPRERALRARPRRDARASGARRGARARRRRHHLFRLRGAVFNTPAASASWSRRDAFARVVVVRVARVPVRGECAASWFRVRVCVARSRVVEPRVHARARGE